MKIISALLTYISIVSLCETTLLWRIEIDPPAYLLGTAHLPYQLLWPSISDHAKEAFDNSTHFLPEFDMTNLFSFTQFRGCMSGAVSEDAKNLLANIFPSKAGDPSSIFDVHLTIEARRMKKFVSSLETVDIYCEFTKFQINSLLSNLTSSSQSSSSENELDIVKKAYNCDLNYPGEVLPARSPYLLDEKIAEFQQRLEEIVGRRDAKMSRLIDGLIKEGSRTNRYFFAVGFIHLMGADGIITRLKRDYNYTITRLCTDPKGFRSTFACQGPSWCDKNDRI